MVDMSKEITFKDGITLDNGMKDLTDSLLDTVSTILESGMEFGLSLDEFDINDELIYFKWRGSKANMWAFYNYYSTKYTTESLEVKKKVLDIIIGK